MFMHFRFPFLADQEVSAEVREHILSRIHEQGIPLDEIKEDAINKFAAMHMTADKMADFMTALAKLKVPRGELFSTLSSLTVEDRAEWDFENLISRGAGITARIHWTQSA